MFVSWRSRSSLADIKLIKALAEQGDANAQFKLAQMYLNFFGGTVEKDAAACAEAVSWLTKAFLQGHSDAMIKLGFMHLCGSVPIFSEQLDGFVFKNVRAESSYGLSGYKTIPQEFDLKIAITFFYGAKQKGHPEADDLLREANVELSRYIERESHQDSANNVGCRNR